VALLPRNDAATGLVLKGRTPTKSMTIRSWATTMALLERMEAPETDA